MIEIKGAEDFLVNSDVIFGEKDVMVTKKELDIVKKYKNRPIFVKYKEFEQLPELETLGFVRLEDRIPDPLFYAFDLPENNRKNLYVLEETTDYIDERVAAFLPVLEVLTKIKLLDQDLNIRSRFRVDTPIFHETMNFYRNGFFLPFCAGEYYRLEAHEQDHSKNNGKRLNAFQDYAKEKQLDIVLHEMFETFIPK